MSEDERYSFIVEWYDPQAAIMRRYVLFFFPLDSTVEMYDLKNRRMFLRRHKNDSLNLEDFYIGKTMNVLGRQLTCVDYGDHFTRHKLNSKQERTFGMIKPDGVNKVGQILDGIQKAGFLVSRLKMCGLNRTEATQLYIEHQHKEFFNDLVNFVCGGPVVAFELMGEGAIAKWRDFMGPTDPAVARTEAPTTIRAKFGTDRLRNACHGSDSVKNVAREIEFFFPSKGPSRQNTATFSDCACCVIKPSAVADGLAGAIINCIAQEGFQITALKQFYMERASAEEFLEVYKGVVREYTNMVTELTSGPCIALEIRAREAAKVFRKFVGPTDPEIARHLRPNTLRAKFGKNKIQNAVHCTDLPEDGVLEVEYFFKILDH